MILDHIRDPLDIQKLNDQEAALLCEELRRVLVQTVCATGGHLASNLGVVELTVAIHRVFDTSSDRLVFDVGHQCYVHKILTGRLDRFDTLRKTGGISGFPKPRESVHDAFVAGHASNSVSVAVGMARARTLQKQSYHVLALLGDGALSGGLSLEGLNDAGASGEPMIVILNDNGMSISPNVGGLSGYLQRLRSTPGYFELKKLYRQATGRTVAGRKVYEISHNMKEAVKKSLLPGSTVFENMGFTYLGPVNGHDVGQLTQILTLAKDIAGPVLIHVRTVKGRGYTPAEEQPAQFHGVGPFDPATGTPLRSGESSFSSVFGRELRELAAQDARICAVTAAMRDGTGLAEFAEEFPQRFVDVGIAEAHACAMSAGMAKQGVIPVFAVYSTFLQRSFDQLLHDVALQKLHVVLAVDRAGLTGADGETHHGVYDPLFLPQVPGMTVYCPANYAELRSMLYQAIYDCDGPAAVRYPRGGEGAYQACRRSAALGDVLREGKDCTILTYGTLINEALSAADMLAEKGIAAEVIKLHRITWRNKQELLELAGGRKCLFVLEECLAAGCTGERLCAELEQLGAAPEKLILRNLGDTVPDQGSVADLYRQFRLDAASVAEDLEEALANE